MQSAMLIHRQVQQLDYIDNWYTDSNNEIMITLKTNDNTASFR